MRRARWLAAGWAVLAVLIWNVIFDLYVSRGAREYLQLRAEFDLGLVPQPAMAEVMARNTQAGLWAASGWAVVVAVAGWVTIGLARQRGRGAR